MKKFSLIFFLFLQAFYFSNNANAQTNIDFSVTNESGMSVTGVYLSPAGLNNWSGNLLSGDSVVTGASFSISQTIDPNKCTYDLKFTDSNSAEYFMHNISLCESKTFAIFKTNDVMK